MPTQVKEGTAPSLSVLLCVNRTSQYLAEAVRSVLSQDDSDFEFLIAANACNDTLIEELQILAGGDSRVRIFRTAIGQLSFNLNYLADRATGDYLIRMDADDISEPSRIRVLRAALADWHPDVLGSWVRFIDDSGRHIGNLKLPTEPSEIVKKLPKGTVFCHPAVAIRKDFLLSMGDSFPRIRTYGFAPFVLGHYLETFLNISCAIGFIKSSRVPLAVVMRKWRHTGCASFFLIQPGILQRG